MQLTEWLDDLCVRFIINLPVEELSSAARICFQIEEAQWFYEDFVRPLDPDFPSLNLRTFSAVMFQHCPLLKEYTAEDQERAFRSFLEYKTMVPVRGAIMLNDDMEQIVLVKGWKKGANWSFPRGKIDQNELDLTCAVREVYEETGYDLREAGLVGNEDDMKSIDIQIRGQDLKMYVFRGVPMDTEFVPRTRKEISRVQWHRLSELPTVKSKKQQQAGHAEDLAGNANKFYMVAPFLGHLKKWISQQQKRDRAVSSAQAKVFVHTNDAEAENSVADQEFLDEQVKDDKLEQDHLNRLLHTLRQSSQAANSDLPEVSQSPSNPLVATGKKPPDSADLKAVLFGNSPQMASMPQTPFEQVIHEPSSPRSPSHQYPHLRPSSNLPKPPVFPIPGRPPQTGSQLSTARNSGIFTPAPDPRLRPIPPPTQPARLAPRPAMLPRASSRDKILPTSQVVQRDITQESNAMEEHQSFAAPPASKLPIPNLNPHKAALLDLFKSDPSLKANGSMPDTWAANFGSNQSASSKAPTILVPSQVSKQSSERVTQDKKGTTTQQAKLLDLFRRPSVTIESRGLGPPEPAVELSASPRGALSRNNSNVATINEAAMPPSKDAVLGQVKIQKRPRRDEAPVSATVSGPLNIPQFDMTRSASEEKHNKKGSKESAKVSPLQILSRPNSSHAHVSLASGTHVSRTSFVGRGQMAYITPSKMEQPATPDLKASDAPPKRFQPQILRRPGTSHSANEPSPIQPLPSPQHKTVKSRDSAVTTDHKTSLLSLFTRSSPIVSPPNAAPTKPVDFPGIKSPIEKSASPPQGQIGATPKDVFAPSSAMNSTEPLTGQPGSPKQSKRFYAPDRMPPPLSQNQTDGSNSVDGKGLASSGGGHPSNASQASTITPANQKYLLGFLKGLK